MSFELYVSFLIPLEGCLLPWRTKIWNCQRNSRQLAFSKLGEHNAKAEKAYFSLN